MELTMNSDKLENENIIKDMEEIPFVIGSIIHLATQMSVFNSQLFDYYLIQDNHKLMNEIFKDYVSIEMLEISSFPEMEDWVYWLDMNKLYGWMLNVKIPYYDNKIKNNRDRLWWTFGENKWIYAKTYEEAYLKARDWAKDKYENNH